MRKILFLFLFFYAITDCFASNAYSVKGIPVKSTARDAMVARESAISYGERSALNVVLKKLNINSPNTSLIKKEEIPTAIRSMQIRNERMTSNSYSATLDIEFSRESLNHLLNKYKIDKYSASANTYLIIPYFKNFLFEKENITFTSFNKNVKDGKGMFVIKKDQLSTTELKNLDKDDFVYENFNKLSDFYSVNNIVFVFTTPDDDDLVSEIYVLNEDGARKSELTTGDSNVDLATTKIIKYLEGLNLKKSAASDTVANGDSVLLFVELDSIKNLNDIEKILSYNTNISTKQMKSMTKKSVVYQIKLKDRNINNFIKALKKDGFTVSEKKDGIHAFL
jgi:hypothetical protein